MIADRVTKKHFTVTTVSLVFPKAASKWIQVMAVFLIRNRAIVRMGQASYLPIKKARCLCVQKHGSAVCCRGKNLTTYGVQALPGWAFAGHGTVQMSC